jgi:hypothetical protein
MSTPAGKLPLEMDEKVLMDGSLDFLFKWFYV